MILKTIKVTNEKNVLVQIPRLVAKKWNLQKGDELNVNITDDEERIVITHAKKVPNGRHDEGNDKVLP